MGIFSEAHEEEIDTLTRERAAFLDERNQTRRELEGVRERMNALAVSNAKLSDNGRIESYLHTLQSLTQLAVDVGIPDAESTGHDTLVVQLREKFRANQMPAGAVCPTGETRVAMPGEWFLWYDGCIIERKGRDNTGQSYPIYRRVESQGAGEGNMAGLDSVADALSLRDLRQEVERLKAQLPQWEHDCERCVFLGRHGEFDLYWCDQGGYPTFLARWGSDGPAFTSYCKAVLDTHPEQFPAQREAMRRAEEKRLPLDETLRRCRDAWDAVRKWGLDVNRDWCKPQWKAIASDGSQGSRYNADPIEAVLELAKTLEKGG